MTNNKPSKQDFGIKFIIPDLPPKEQLEMVKDLREIILTFAKVAGEKADTTQFDEAIAKLEAQL